MGTIMHEHQGDRGGYRITLSHNGNLKLETWSAYSDEQDWTYYIHPTDDLNAATDWAAPINQDGNPTTYADLLIFRAVGGDYYRRIVVQ